jgi:hypothetical protein
VHEKHTSCDCELSCLSRVDGKAARARYDRYGGGLFPVAWYDLQSFFAARLPPGVLETASALERYEPGGADAPVTVHLQVPSAPCRVGWRASLMLTTTNISGGCNCSITTMSVCA